MIAPTAAAPRLDPKNAVYLPIDYMHGLISACRSIEPGTLRNNAIALTKVARLFGLPTFGTGDRSGRTYLGAEMSEIEALIPSMTFFNRSSVGAWDAPGYADAVRATGRRQLIMAGITTEQCVTFTAQPALAEGFQVFVVLDASASLDARSEMAAVARLTAMGAVVTTWSPLAAELLGDFARPEGRGLIQIYSEHQGSLRMLEDAFNVASLLDALRRSSRARRRRSRRAGVLYVGSTGELSSVTSSGNRFGLVLQLGKCGVNLDLQEVRRCRQTGAERAVPAAQREADQPRLRCRAERGCASVGDVALSVRPAPFASFL